MSIRRSLSVLSSSRLASRSARPPPKRSLACRSSIATIDRCISARASARPSSLIRSAHVRGSWSNRSGKVPRLSLTGTSAIPGWARPRPYRCRNWRRQPPVWRSDRCECRPAAGLLEKVLSRLTYREPDRVTGEPNCSLARATALQDPPRDRGDYGFDSKSPGSVHVKLVPRGTALRAKLTRGASW